MIKASNFLVVTIFVVFSVFATIIGGANWLDCVKFLFAQFLCVLLPGVFVNALIKHDYGNSTKFYLSSYAIGYGLSIIIYLVCMFIGVQKYVYIPAIILSLISALYIIKHNQTKGIVIKNDLYFISLLLTVCYMISLFGFEGRTLIPTDERVLLTHQDNIYWLRNCVIVSQGYPLKDLSFLGQSFQYHFFSCAGIAYLHYLTRIDLYFLCFVYSYLIHLTLYIGSLYILGDYIITRKRNLYVAMLFCLFISGIEKLTDIYYLYHIYFYVAHTEALAFSLFSFYYFLILYRSKQINYAIYGVGLFLFFCAIGLKATLSCFVLSGIGLGCLFMFFKQNLRKNALVIGSGYFVSFLLALIILMSGSSIENTRNTYELSLFGSLFHSGVFENLFHYLLAFLKFQSLTYILVFLVYFICINPLLFYLLYRGMKAEGKMTDIGFFLLAIFVIGILCGIFFNQFGMAQMYFFIAAFPFGIFYAFNLLNHVDVLSMFKKSLVFKCLILLCFIILITELRPVAGGIKTILGYNNGKIDKSKDILTKGEYDGLRWIKDNIPVESVLITNKVLIAPPGNQTTCYTSAITERQVYYECFGYVDSKGYEHVNQKLSLIKRVFGGDEKAINHVKKNGVDYIVSFKVVENSDMIEGIINYNGKHGYRYLPPQKSLTGNVVFENEDLYVIKL